MIELTHISLQRSGKFLLDDASLRIHPGEHVALIGANGSGKSSLFALLLGKLTVDSGEISLPSQWRLAHMAQEVDASQRSALDYVIDGHRDYRETEAQLDNCTDDHQLAALHARLDALDAWSIPARAEQLLHGLGFQQTQLQNPVADFSGGWRIRLNLAQALMCPSDLLLLDEPTNHLDLDATLWLEQWLRAYPGTLVLISHDRDFIDAACNQVVHIEHKQLHSYRGNYSAFEQQRAERLAQQQQAFEKQQREIAHMEDFVRRFRAKATKARQAQSRIKAMERMTRIAPAHVDSPFNFRFLEPRRFSDPLLTINQASLGYQQPVLEGINLSIHPGTRLGLLGTNGAGKSTLLKSLAGEVPLLTGERTSGEHLALGYFSQHQLETLDLNASPLVQLQRAKPQAREQEILNFLGGFNFRGDMATGSCRHFSGGEKARLTLALVVWQQPNLLLLDEPTNHLDLDMCHALTMAMQDFSGALVLVSHDRHLLRNTVDEFLLVHDGRAEAYDGDLDDYRKWLLQGDRRDNEENASLQASTSSSGNKKQNRQEAAARRARLQPLRKELQQLEKRMASAAEKLSSLEQALLDTGLYDDERKDELQALLQKQGELKRQAETMDERWLTLQEELDQLQPASN